MKKRNKIFSILQANFVCNFLLKNSTLIITTVNSAHLIQYNHVIFLINHAKTNHLTYFVRHNRVFIVTVTVITEFESSIIARLRSKWEPIILTCYEPRDAGERADGNVIDGRTTDAQLP